MPHGHFPIAGFQHAVLGDLRAGSRGGWDGDEGCASRRQRLRSTDDFEKIVEVGAGSSVGEHGGYALAGVHGCAAADGDDGAAVVAGREGDRGLGGRGRGLAARAVVDDCIDALGFEGLHEWRGEAVGLAGDDERGLVGASLEGDEVFNEGRDLLGCAAAEHDARGGHELERRDGWRLYHNLVGWRCGGHGDSCGPGVGSGLRGATGTGAELGSHDGWVCRRGGGDAGLHRAFGLVHLWIGPPDLLSSERSGKVGGIFIHKEVAHARHGRHKRDGRRRRTSRRHARR